MKKLLFLLTILLAVTACKEEKTPVDYAIVSGKISNASEEFSILATDRTVDHKIKLAEDGTFRDTIRIPRGAYLFNDGSQKASIYLENGADIVVNVDATDFDNTINISGKGSEASNYLREKEKMQTELTKDRAAFFSLEENEFKQKISEFQVNLENLLETSNSSEDFKTMEMKDLHFGSLNTLNSYEASHARFTAKPDFKVSDGFSPELTQLAYDNEADYIASKEYKRIVTDYYMSKTSDMMQKDSLSVDDALMSASKSIQNETIRNDFLYSNSKTFITFSDDVERYYLGFKEISTNDEHINEMGKIYNDLVKVTKGKQSPKFVNYENNAGGTTSLDDLQGKFVYIDVWATWCGPCKYEIPFLKEVEKKYHGKNIEFVSLSVDRPADYDKWKKMIVDMELTGIQLLADNNFDSQFIKDYMVKGIPKFIFLDPEGKIISSSAPRPSDPKLITLFDEYEI